jgi:septal ring factor EnvC (AmiA/AmiB activator)
MEENEELPPQKEDKDYEKEIKEMFPVPITPATPEGQRAKREMRDKQDGARWFLNTIHLPAMKEKDEEVWELKKEIRSRGVIISDDRNEKAKLRKTITKQSAEIEKLREALSELVKDIEADKYNFRLATWSKVNKALKPKE